MAAAVASGACQRKIRTLLYLVPGLVTHVTACLWAFPGLVVLQAHKAYLLGTELGEVAIVGVLGRAVVPLRIEELLSEGFFVGLLPHVSCEVDKFLRAATLPILQLLCVDSGALRNLLNVRQVSDGLISWLFCSRLPGKLKNGRRTLALHRRPLYNLTAKANHIRQPSVSAPFNVPP